MWRLFVPTRAGDWSKGSVAEDGHGLKWMARCCDADKRRTSDRTIRMAGRFVGPKAVGYAEAYASGTGLHPGVGRIVAGDPRASLDNASKGHIVGSNTMLMFMLAAIFAMAGIQHLLVFVRNRRAFGQLWFGAASLAAAGSAAAQGVALHGSPAAVSILGQYLPVAFGMAWIVAATWFGVRAEGDGKRRQTIALVATLLAVVYGLGTIWIAAPAHPSIPSSPPHAWHLVGLAALVMAVWLTAGGARRQWSSARRVDAAAMAGMGLALAIAGVVGVGQGRGFAVPPQPALYAFLCVVMVMAYALARAVDGEDMPQRQQRELAHTSRLSIVGELTASIAHEINQPLGAILSNADAGDILLENPEPPLDEIRQILVDIRRDGVRASDVIRHVRKLVRKRELELERIDANGLMADVAALLAPEARKRRIPIVPTLSAAPVDLYGDRALLEQMLINLIMNAMDAVEAGDAVEDAVAPIAVGVSTTSHGEIELHVIDAGAGIPADRLEHLFDSFYTSKAHGMGLGLSISRSVVEAHGGRIHAQNNSGAGATFRVTLPPFDATTGNSAR